MTPWHPILDIALDAAPLLRATGSIVHPGRLVLFGAVEEVPEGASVTPHAVSWYERAVHVRMVTTPTEEDITREQFDAARAAGLTDAEMVEVITVVALNIFTNMLGKATQVDIDFPKIALLGAQSRLAA